MSLEDRVAELERRTIRYRNALVLLVVGVCAVAVVGATTDDGVIRGTELRIRNGAGQDVFVVMADTDGNGAVSVRSKTGMGLFSAGASNNGNGFLSVRSKTGTNLVQVGSSRYGGALSVRSASGTERIQMGATDNGFILRGHDKTGEEVIQLSVDDHGNGLVGAYNRKGTGKTLQPGP